MSNIVNDETGIKEYWKISSTKPCVTSRTALLGSKNIILDYVKAQNLEFIFCRGAEKISLIRLSGVPAFLIDAFCWLEKTDSLKIDGLFRKEGNSNRIKSNTWAIFCGLSPLPVGCNAHDVCSLIKRFFREIKTPIFSDLQDTLLKFVEQFSENRDVLTGALYVAIERLPASHFSCLAFLLRQLKKVSEYSSQNHMTIENLATVFAPSLFRDEMLNRFVQQKQNLQIRLMDLVRSRNNLQIRLVRTLIEMSYMFVSEKPLSSRIEQQLQQSSVPSLVVEIPPESCSSNRTNTIDHHNSESISIAAVVKPAAATHQQHALPKKQPSIKRRVLRQTSWQPSPVNNAATGSSKYATRKPPGETTSGAGGGPWSRWTNARSATIQLVKSSASLHFHYSPSTVAPMEPSLRPEKENTGQRAVTKDHHSSVVVKNAELDPDIEAVKKLRVVSCALRNLRRND